MSRRAKNEDLTPFVGLVDPGGTGLDLRLITAYIAGTQIMAQQALLFTNRTVSFPTRPTTPAPPPEPRQNAPHPLLAELGDSLARTLMTARELRRDADRRHQPVRQTRIETIDSLLGGLPRGTLTEIHGSRSSGRMSLVTSAIAAITSTGENAALVDHGDNLDPKRAETGGVDLSRLLWVRPESVADAAHAAEILLGTGFPLVVLDLGLRLRGKRVPDTGWVRLERAASENDAILLVSSPWPVTGIASRAVLNVTRGRGVWRKGAGGIPLLEGARARVETTRHRHHRTGGEDLMGIVAAETIPQTGSWRTESRTRPRTLRG